MNLAVLLGGYSLGQVLRIDAVLTPQFAIETESRRRSRAQHYLMQLFVYAIAQASDILLQLVHKGSNVLLQHLLCEVDGTNRQPHQA